MPEIAREGLCRSVNFTLTRDATDTRGDGLSFAGYGAVFDSVTTIDSWEGSFEETVARGAFKRTLRERTPKLQFDHGRHPLIGSIPIGRFDDGFPKEDEKGLLVQARLTDNWLIQPVRDAIAEESIDGMSFRFSVVQEEWRTAAGKVLTDPEEIWRAIFEPSPDGLLRRTLKEVKLSEVGPVVWPAYDDTTAGVRSGQVVIDLARLSDPDTKRALARAVFLADNAEQDGPQANEPRPAEHPEPGPQGSRGTSGEHPSSTPPDRSKLRADMSRFAEYARVVVATASKGAPSHGG